MVDCESELCSTCNGRPPQVQKPILWKPICWICVMCFGLFWTPPGDSGVPPWSRAGGCGLQATEEFGVHFFFDATSGRLGKKLILQDVQAQLVSWPFAPQRVTLGHQRKPRSGRMRRYVRNRQSGRRLEP